MYIDEDYNNQTAEKVNKLLQQMTLEEKVNQVLVFNHLQVGLDDDIKITTDNIPKELKLYLEKGLGSLFGIFKSLEPKNQASSINTLQRYTIENSRLKIPLLMHYETLHGFTCKKGTTFPQAIALASTWNRELVKQVHSAIALEVRSRGGHIGYSPVLDIVTDPRWGRMQETYGEDTYINSEMGVAAVRGFQGSGPRVDNKHIAAVAKHFAGYGQAEGGRNFAPSYIPERTFIDKILPPFEAVVKRAGVLGIMVAHQEIDGIPCHNNSHLLLDILRKDWGFNGVTVSDANDIHRLYEFHKVVETPVEAVAEAVKNRIAFDILSSKSYIDLKSIVEEKPELEEYLNNIVSDILHIKYYLGLFENPYVDEKKAEKVSYCKRHKNIAKKAALESIVMLKNDGILPLNIDKIKSIAVIGPNADPVQCGTYSVSWGTSIYEGLKETIGDRVKLNYAEGCRITKFAREDFVTEDEINRAIFNPKLISDEDNIKLINEAVKTAIQSEVVILCAGGNNFTAREAVYLGDHRGDRDDLNLPGSQNILIEAIYNTGKPVILILNNGRAYSISKETERSNAVIETWFIGTETGYAVSDILFGNENPSGKLTVTFPKFVGQLPVYYNQKPSSSLKKYLFTNNDPIFPFGHGLSYTTFEYSNLLLSKNIIKKDESVKISVDITNTGKVKGDEVVQLYIRDEYCSVVRPVMELKGFEKIMLKPCEKKTVKFLLTPDHLAFTDINYKKTVEPGGFSVMVGGSSVSYLIVKLTVAD